MPPAAPAPPAPPANGVPPTNPNSTVTVGGGGPSPAVGTTPNAPWTPGQNPFTIPTAGGGTNVLSHLWGQYSGAPGGQTFAGGYSPTAGPTPTGAQGYVASAYQPGQFSAPGSSGTVQSATQQAVMNALGQTPYSTETATQTFGALSGQIDDEFALKQKALGESLASRGLGSVDDSTIGLGNLSDLNIGQRSAKTQLADSLLREQATTNWQAQQGATAQAAGFGNQLYSQGANTYGINANAGQQGFQNVLSALGFNNAAAGQTFGQDLATAEFGANQNQQGFQNDATTYGINQNAEQQAFEQQQQWLNQYMGAGQQNFNNELATNAANQQGDQAYLAYLMSMMGGLN